MANISTETTSISEKGTKQDKVIHFSDGSTMRVDHEDPNGDTMKSVNVINTQIVGQGTSINSSPEDTLKPVDMTWGEWFRHYSYKGGSAVMGKLEYTGESLAYYLGITTPKYQHEIDEYQRMMSKKHAEEEESKAWASTNPSSVPIVMEQIKGKLSVNHEEESSNFTNL